MRSAAEFVEGFGRFWSDPSLDGFAVLLRQDVTLVQPLAASMHGLEEVRAGFAPIFAWLPDLHGEVDGWGVAGKVVFIEFRLKATIGGRPFEWPLVDRFVLDEEGMAVERVSYFDSLRLVLATLLRPSGWWRFLRSGAAASIVRRAPRAP